VDLADKLLATGTYRCGVSDMDGASDKFVAVGSEATEAVSISIPELCSWLWGSEDILS
jgi:hypothetical protein